MVLWLRLLLDILKFSTKSGNIKGCGGLFGDLRCKFIDEVADLTLKPELLLEEVVLDVHEGHLQFTVQVMLVLVLETV